MYSRRSYTFGLVGESADLHANVQDSVHTDEGHWRVGLLHFSAPNAPRNITEDNNVLTYYTSAGQATKVIVPPGAYSLTSLLDAIQGRLPKPEIIQLLGNNSTKQVGLYSTVHIDLRADKSLHKILGFAPIFLRSHQWYISTEPVELRHLETIRIHCNIVAGSFGVNGPNTVLHEFAPRSPIGYPLLEKPRHIIYLPINSHQRVTEIIVTLTDQQNRPLDFGGHRIHARLHLVRWD